jgi:KDO2-lipid IV(A) lauroyltransferase
MSTPSDPQHATEAELRIHRILPSPSAIGPSFTSRLAYRILPIRQSIVRANLERAFGRELDKADREQLAKAFYAHFLRSLREFLVFPLLSRQTRASMVTTIGENHFFEAAESGRGILLLGAHLGNWEVALTGAMLNYPAMYGHIHVIRRPFKPVWLERYARNRFAASGLGTIEKRNSMPEILRRLAINDAVGFVMDQHSAPKEGVRVPFFGSPAWTFRSLAVIARRTRAPVIPIASWRESDRRHVVQLGKPLEWIVSRGFEEEVMLNTQSYNEVLEGLIRAHPEQWIWNHRRWKDENS